MGFMKAGSKLKYLRCITGRHDLPFFYPEEVKVQKSFLDAFLKGIDDRGWSVPGKVPQVDLRLRIGNPGFNDAEAEIASFPQRVENEWPLERTQYQKYHLSSSQTLLTVKDDTSGCVRYESPR
jgi:hypothetical protein